MPALTPTFRNAFALILISFLSLSGIQASIEFRQTLQLEEVEIGNLLTWSTASQGSMTHFTVEKSLDGQSYTSIGEVPVQFSSNAEALYRFLDLSLGESAAYYRLVFLQENGEHTITPSVYSSRATGNNLKISDMTSTVTQSPFIFHIESVRQFPITITLNQLDGPEVLRYSATVQGGDNKMVLEMDHLPSGYYLMELTANQETERLIIQKVSAEDVLQGGYVIRG